MIRFISLAIAFSAPLALTTSCGGSSSPNVTPIVAPAVRADASGDLLYVAVHTGGGAAYRGILSVVTFPGGKPVNTIDLSGYPSGVCSDMSGNVWVVQENHHVHVADEYAHGGMKPIAQIHVPHGRALSMGCAVDPTTGNLAVLVAGGVLGRGFVEVWAGARPGKPASFAVSFYPTGCTYDGSGNLFVDGYEGSGYFEFAELSKGSSRVEPVKLNKRPYNIPGGVAWDGTYVDLADNDGAGPGKIYRISVSSYEGRVAAIVRFAQLNYAPMFALSGDWLVGTSGLYGHAVSLWHFPAGGPRVKVLERSDYPATGVTISRGQ